MNDKTPMHDVIDQAKQQGWRHEVSGSGHHKLMPPNGKPMVVTSVSPGDGRAYKNFLAAMRRSGFKEADAREEALEKRRVHGVKAMLREYLRDNSTKPFGTDELRLVTLARFPDASPNAHNTALGLLYNAGDIVRLERGQYRWAKDESAVPASVPVLTLETLFKDKPVNGASAVPVPQEATTVEPKPGNRVSELLARFLDIVAEIETVLREHEKIEAAKGELRKLLGGS